LSYDARKTMKAHANGLFIPFHMEIYPKRRILKLQSPQPFVTYAFIVTIYL